MMEYFESAALDITQNNFEEKIRRVYNDLSIDKRRLPASQLQKRGVPAYVGEWVLDTIVHGDGDLSPDEALTVQKWADKFIPSQAETNVIKHRLLTGDVIKVLTPVQVEVELSRRRQEQVGKMTLLGINDAIVEESFARQFPELLKQGMWGVVQLVSSDEGVTIDTFKPMQASLNLEMYKDARKEFTLDEWRSLMITSMGYNPKAFNEEEKTLMLCRLLPLVQKNMHLMELAPKGTGKSYIYENVSPYVRLISGGNVSPAVLFVNNMTGQPGLLARFAVVVLDEVQTLKFEKPEEIVGGLKGYLANGKLTRGGLYEIGSDCGLVLLANIMLDSNQQPLTEPLIRELPGFLQETAFLDRIRGIIPGWKLPKLSGECFAKGVGLKSDFFGDALIALRNDLHHDQSCVRRIHFRGKKVYKRNEDSVRSIASGLMKILFPAGVVSDNEFDYYCVRPAIQLRQLIWQQIQMLDAEYRQYESEISYELMSE